MKLRVAMISALLGLGLGFVVLVSPTPPAWACSCALRAAESRERADLVVVGTVTEVTRTSVRLAVESVEKGSAGVGVPLRLTVSPGEAGCGYDFRAGSRYRVNSLAGHTGLCAGIVPLPAGSPATPATAVPSGSTASAPPATAASAPTEVGRPWLVAGAVLAAVVGGLVVVLSRRRRRPTAPDGGSAG